MTGKEKIQAVIDTINEERQRVVTNTVVEIYSRTLTDKGLSFSEQQQVLDVLADDRKWIKYTSEYISEAKTATIVDRLKPDLIRLMPKSLRGKQTEELFLYTIEILENYGRRGNHAAKKKAVTKNTDSPVLSQTYEVTLRLNSKTLNLYIGTAKSVPLKRFKTKKSNIHKAYHALQNSKGRSLTREQMGIGNIKSEVDDIVKSMNLEKVFTLANFIDVDMQNQTLKIPLKTEITAEKLEILKSLSIEKVQ